MQRTLALRYITILTSLTLFAAGCGASGKTSGEQMKTPTRPVVGEITAGQGVSGADVAVLDTSGKTLVPSTTNVRTYKTGTFEVRIRKLPTSIRVTASGGTAGGHAFSGTLKADLENFDADTAVAAVNPVTTLVAAYRDRNKPMSLIRAQSAVRRFLKLPDGEDLGQGLDVTHTEFSEQKFVDAAEHEGGFDTFIAKLAREVGTKRTRTFVGTEHNLGPLAIAVVGGIVSGVAGAAAQTGIGFVLDKFGIAIPGGPPPFDPAVLAPIQAQLTEIQGTLNTLAGQVQAIQNQIADANYAQLVSQTADYVGAVKTLTERLVFLSKTDPSNRTFIDSEVRYIKDSIEREIVNKSEGLNLKLVGQAGADGIIKAWDKRLQNQYVCWSVGQWAKTTKNLNYWETVQLAALVLEVEFENSRSAPASKITGLVDTFKSRREQQDAQLRKPSPGTASILRRTGLMWLLYPLGGVQHYLTKPASATDHLPTVKDSLDGVTANPSILANPPVTGWRLPTEQEVKDLILGWNGANPAAWLRAQNCVISISTPPQNIPITSTSEGGSFKSIDFLTGQPVTIPNTEPHALLLVRGTNPSVDQYWWP